MQLAKMSVNNQQLGSDKHVQSYASLVYAPPTNQYRARLEPESQNGCRRLLAQLLHATYMNVVSDPFRAKACLDVGVGRSSHWR
eukprot:6178517-Pleurochrysis_carterae.AAC.1